MKILVILSVLISLKTCQSTAKSFDTANLPTSLDGSYHIETLNNSEASAYKLVIHFNKKEQQLSGFSGCNRFMGPYTLEGNSIKIGPLASTKMFCGDPANHMEFDLLEALSKIDNMILKDGILQFLSQKTVLVTAVKKEDTITFNYSAISRGRFLDITVNDSLVSVSKDRDSKPVSKTIAKETWKKLNILLETIPLDSLSTLKSPTEARFYDGASIGKLEIKKNDTVYESASFDHGTPPKDIEALVKEILSLSENLE